MILITVTLSIKENQKEREVCLLLKVLCILAVLDNNNPIPLSGAKGRVPRCSLKIGLEIHTDTSTKKGFRQQIST